MLGMAAFGGQVAELSPEGAHAHYHGEDLALCGG